MEGDAVISGTAAGKPIIDMETVGAPSTGEPTVSPDVETTLPRAGAVNCGDPTVMFAAMRD